MRIDKYLSTLWVISRRDIKYIVKQKLLSINWRLLDKSDYILQKWDKIIFQNNEIDFLENVYVILNKPSWYVSSDDDEYQYKSYKHLLDNCPYKKILHVAGRLDQDTEWLLLLGSDWEFIHKIISPKWNKDKEYEVHLEKDITENDILKLSEWVFLDDWYKTLPAKVNQIDQRKILLTIREWKYHQVKRMMESIWNKVIFLKRIRVDIRTLDWLKVWEWKYIVL
jgi:16S rRNA pseudouridine516 synthase